jgi:long-chain acyl-CoA synthetase
MATDFNPRYSDMVELLSSAVSAFGARPLFGIRQERGWNWTTYRGFAATVDRCRAGLAALGVGHGDRVAVISNNRLRWAVAAHATYGLSAVHVPIHATQLEKDWKDILQDSGARVCFVDGEAIEARVRSLQADLYNLEHIVNFDGSGNDGTSFDGLLASGASSPVEQCVPDARKDVAAIIYTAGISGKPKGVRLTHFNLASNVSALVEASGIPRGSLTVSFLPWSNVLGGVVEMNLLMATGGAMAICGNPSRLMEYVREVRPTALFAVPRIWNRIRSGALESVASLPGFVRRAFDEAMQARSKQRAHRNLSLSERAALRLARAMVFRRILKFMGGRIGFASSGGAALPLETEEFFENLGIPIFQGYGLTECSGCVTTSSPRTRRTGSVGRPIPGVMVSVDGSVDQAPEGEGEVVVSGPGVMEGYHNLLGETVETITERGALRTGDLGRVDADGYLYITGTLKDIYKLANGRYVAPAPLEARLQGSPYIAQCMVYGTNRAHNVALIVPDLAALMIWGTANGMSPFIHTLLKDPRTRRLFEDEIARYSRDFKSFERIRNFALIRQELSASDDALSTVHRLKRRAIADTYAKTLRELYGEG